MSAQDAYAPPQSTVRDVSGGTGMMSDSIVASLRKTRPWVLLIAILGFIFAVLMVLGGISMLLGGGMMSGMEGVEGMEGAGMLGGGMMIGGGILYLIMGIIYFLASLYLLRYAGAIKRAVTGLSVVDLEMALSNQASFWKLIGILTLISVLVLIASIVFMGIGGAMYMGAGM